MMDYEPWTALLRLGATLRMERRGTGILGVDAVAVRRRSEILTCSAIAKTCTLTFQNGYKPSQKLIIEMYSSNHKKKHTEAKIVSSIILCTGQNERCERDPLSKIPFHQVANVEKDEWNETNRYRVAA